jgi:pyrroloquinoline-quinone synthase
MELWTRLEVVADRLSVLRHPFYRRWSAGELTSEELARYSGQYRHAVLALAEAARAASRSPEAGADAPVLAAHAREEAEHVNLWDEFVASVGGDSAAEANVETRTCASVWAGQESRPLLHTLVAMYAIESAQPQISETKQEGLTRHYGIAPAAYFEVHAHRDIEHAAEVRALIEKRLSTADEDGLVATAEDVLGANLLLLDGVDTATARSPAFAH